MPGMNVANTPSYQALSALQDNHAQRGIKTTAYKPGLLFGRSEISLSEAAQRLQQGKAVDLEDTLKFTTGSVSYSDKFVWQKSWTPHTVQPTITQRRTSRLSSAEEVQQMMRVETGAAPQTAVEALAAKLKPYSMQRQGATVFQIASGKSNDKTFSPYTAAQVLMSGKPIRINQLHTQSMINNLIQGASEAEILERCVETERVGGEADVDRYRLSHPA